MTEKQKNEYTVIAKYMCVEPCDRCNDPYCENNLPDYMTWMYLMPVVEKITQHKYDDGDTAYIRTFGMLSADNNKPMVRINRQPLWEKSTLIEATYLAVFKFIWLNNLINP